MARVARVRTQSASGRRWCELDLENIPDLPLPDGVEIRAGHTGDDPPDPRSTPRSVSRATGTSTKRRKRTSSRSLDDPLLDDSMWKIAWAGDTVVGQVKSFINAEENAEMGYLRGYTEYISTHADWRNKGIAGALLAASLRELKARGMTEAALGVDTDEPGRRVPAVHQVGLRAPCLRSGVRQAVDLKQRRIWSATMTDGRSCSSVSNRRAGRGARRSAPSTRRDPLARSRTRRRLEPGRSPGLDPGHVPATGATSYDWRAREVATEPLRSVHHRRSTGSTSTSSTNARRIPTHARW